VRKVEHNPLPGFDYGIQALAMFADRLLLTNTADTRLLLCYSRRIGLECGDTSLGAAVRLWRRYIEIIVDILIG
jgi:hypothetical protein